MQFKSTPAAAARANVAWHLGRRQARRWTGFAIVFLGMVVAYAHVVEGISR